MRVARPFLHLPVTEPWLGVNFWSRRGGPLMWRTYDDALVRAELALMADHGVRLTRSFLYWPDFHPHPDTIDEAYVQRYRQFLTAHEDLGMQTIPTFIVGHMSGQNWDVSWRGGRDLYADGFVLGQQAFFIREITARIKQSPAVCGWLISNEMPIYGGPTTPEYARAWAQICVDAVRAGGSPLPVSLGDGAWTREVIGSDNGFRLRDQLDIVDFFGPHSYPMGDDQIRQLTRAALVCELAQLGKPVVLEEFGVTSAFVSEDNAGHYYRQTLHHSLLAGATGWIGWNNTDFDLLDQAPYSHHGYELNFGVSTTAGEPKAALLELQQFRRVLDAVDVEHCSRPDSATAVVVPSFLDMDHPMNDEDYQSVITGITHQGWLAARRADLAPAVVRESVGIPQADLLLIPSAKALLSSTFEILTERARAGSHVYLSFFAGPGSGQRGSWWPHLQPLFGVRHLLRYGLSEIAAETVELTVSTAFGGLTTGTRLVLAAGGNADSRAYLPLEVVDADVAVLLTDQEGRPALVRKPVGAGAMLLGAYPLEWFAAARRDGNLDDPTPRLYAALAAEAGIAPAVSVPDDRVMVDSLRHEDGTTFSWLVNLVDRDLKVEVGGPSGQTLTDVLDGSKVAGPLSLSPFGVTVLRHG